jgi:L-ascorbate metabolism protein UlaG (beta-lactamase superfamily)
MQISDLPALDFCLLSHHHGDHFDDVAARELDKELPVVTTPHGADKLHTQGFGATTALETWQSTMVEHAGSVVRITAMPGKHGPDLVAPMLPPVMGTMLEFQDADARAFNLYISGDTLMHDDLQEIPRRYPEIDLALFHLGGTQILGMLLTMDSEQGTQALVTIRPRMTIPIHYDDYTVFRSPLDDFKRAVEQEDLRQMVHYLDRGESYRFELPDFDQRRAG